MEQKEKLIEFINMYLYNPEKIENYNKFKKSLTKKLKKYLKEEYKGLLYLKYYLQILEDKKIHLDKFDIERKIINALEGWNSLINEEFYHAYNYITTHIDSNEDILEFVRKKLNSKINDKDNLKDISLRLAISCCFPNNDSIEYAYKFRRLFIQYGLVNNLYLDDLSDIDKIMLINDLKKEKDKNIQTLERFNYEFR